MHKEDSGKHRLPLSLLFPLKEHKNGYVVPRPNENVSSPFSVERHPIPYPPQNHHGQQGLSHFLFSMLQAVQAISVLHHHGFATTSLQLLPYNQSFHRSGKVDGHQINLDKYVPQDILFELYH